MIPIRPKLAQPGRRLFFVALWVVVGIFFCWSVGGIYYLNWLPWIVRAILAAAYLFGGVVVWKQLTNKRRWLIFAAASTVAVYLVTLTQRPANDRVWVLEQAHMPTITVDNGHVKIDHFRHSKYRSETDFDAAFEDFDFELDQLDSVWFLVQRFTTLDGLAHTFISFGLETDSGPQFFSVSVEIRREQGEVFSPIRGLYRQYELMYVVGDERDLIGVRTNYREADRVYMYKVNATPAQAQQLFLEVADRSRKLKVTPEFYNTMFNNCSNNIVSHTYKLTPEPINPLDPRIAVPGYSARFAYAMGLIGSEGQSFRELQTQSRIDVVAKQAGITSSFSDDIRAAVMSGRRDD